MDTRNTTPPPEHVRWRKVGESVTSPYRNTQRKEVFIDPCECIKKFFDAAKAIAERPAPYDPTGSQQAKAMRPLRGVRRFHADYKAYEYGKTAEAVYGDSAPAKWRIASKEELREYGFKNPNELEIEIKDADGSIGKSPFKAQIYVPVNERFCEPMPAVLVFKGTTMTEPKDWANNAEQAMDAESDYYRKAVRIGAKQLKQAKKPIVVVGHSLGGGLAAACAQAAGKDCWTFNAAGLHPNTLQKYGEKALPVNIEAYRHEGEVLTAVQEPGWAVEFAKVIVPPLAGFWYGGPLGAFAGAYSAYKLHKLPAAPGNRHSIACANDRWDAVDRHGMANTLISFNQQLRQAEATLREQTGVQCAQPVVV
ncbi:MAG: hypothetical protein ACKOWC_02820 [Limnohabitans sp.]